MKTKVANLKPMQKFGLGLFILDLAVVLGCLTVDFALHSSALPYEELTLKAGKDFTVSLSELALAVVLFLVWCLALALNKT
ncbi:MAG: hypothetical protein WCO24_04905, partial [Actinomycetes bacterium]